MRRATYLAACFLIAAIATPRSSFGEDADGYSDVIELLAEIDDADLQHDLLSGIREGLRGRRNLKAPSAWPGIFEKLSASADRRVVEDVVHLAFVFGDTSARKTLEAIVEDREAKPEKRRWATAVLIEQRAEGIDERLLGLIEDPELSVTAILGLAEFANDAVPPKLLSAYPSLAAASKRAAVSTLASREAWASHLLDALAKGLILRRDVSAFVARQVSNYKNPRLTKRLAENWGKVSKVARDKKRLIREFKAKLDAATLAKAELDKGRTLFKKTCGTCHKVKGEGGTIAQDLTGSDRRNIDYLLLNILDPSAAVPAEYRLRTFVTKRGRTVSGITKEKSKAAIRIQTVDELLVLPTTDIAREEVSEFSLMPEGLLLQLSENELRDLFGYLMN